MRKLLRKNLNVMKEYGPLSLPVIYTKVAWWHLLHFASAEKRHYRKVAINGRPMLIDARDSGISKALFIYGVRERDQMHIIEHFLASGATVLDIGANIGYYVLFASAVAGEGGRIIAYEPSKENYNLLQRNIELNNLTERVSINNAAVSNKSGKSRFYISDKSNLHTLNPTHYKGSSKREPDEKSTEVATANIYEIINEHRDIQFIRMDIEGHEVEVLDGFVKAARDLKVYPDVLFETHFRKYDARHHDIGGVLQELFALGYYPKILTATDEKRTELRQRGYIPKTTVYTDRACKDIYEGVSCEDALDFICAVDVAKAVLLKRA